MQKAAVRALEKCGLNGEGYAKKNLTKNKSVDTGNLRNSITHEVNESERAAYIGSAVDPSAITSSLKGSYSYHNHPMAHTNYSFSAEDVAFFINSEEAVSMASDELFSLL